MFTQMESPMSLQLPQLCFQNAFSQCLGSAHTKAKIQPNVPLIFFFPLQVSASELNELIITLWHLKQWKGVLIQRFSTEAEFAKITWGDFFNSYICLLLPTQNLKFLIELISVKKHNFSSESCNDFNVASSRDHLWTT